MTLRSTAQTLSLTGLAVAISATMAGAQTDTALSRISAADTGRIFRLGSVQVRASRPVSQAFTQAVGAATLRLNDRNDLARALTLFPGVTLSNVGPRNEAGVNVRGFDLRQVPLFIDGIPVYVPYDGYVDLRRFTTFDAAEVNLSKGFSSVLMGPNALGGAINVVTRRPTTPLEASGGTAFSSGSGVESYLNFGLRRAAWYAQASGSVVHQETWPLPNKFSAVSTQGAGDRNNALRDDKRLSAKVGITTQQGNEYVLGYANQAGEKGNPPYAGTASQTVRYWRWPQWDKRSIYALSQTRLGNSGHVNARVYYDRFDNTLKSFDDDTYTTQDRGSSFTSIYHDNTYGGSIELGQTLSGSHRLAAAAHFKLDRHNEFDVGDPERHFRDRTTSIALQDVYEPGGPITLIGGVSYERRNALRAEALENGGVVPLEPGSSDAWNPELAGVYDLTTKGSLRASIARKTRFPTIKDRYSYRLGQAIPNPDLTSERATHYELRYATPAGASWSFEVSAFWSSIDDAIQRVDSVTQTASGTWVFQLQNLGRAEAKGFEVSASHRLSGWATASGHYTRLNRRNITSPSVKFTDSPPSTATVNLLLTPTPCLGFVTNVDWNSWRYSSSAGERVSAFAVADAKAMLSVRPGLTVEARVRNLFDRNYQLVSGYPEPGRVFTMGLRYAIVRGEQ